MKCEVEGRRVFFTEDGLEAGCYQRDPAKPFLHPLRTASGHVLTLATPHDHLHHKGLMFALQTPEVSWWDEVPHPDSLTVGRQRETSLSTNSDGLVQELVWEAVDGSHATFEERRKLNCSRVDGGFAWSWRTTLTALRDCTLSQALHSKDHGDGRRTNYQGLSLRLPRALAMGSRLFVSNDRVPFGEATGASVTDVRVEGRVDPVYPSWPGPAVEVSITTPREQGLFALNQPFPYLALGPSNLRPLELAAGEILDLEYEVVVRDRQEG